MPDFSIIICTYNPDIRIIKRCLNATLALSGNGLTHEVIIVENNCTAPLKNTAELNEILNKFHSLKILAEPKPGLSNARITGVQNANSPWIVFFDDDNEPNKDYLPNLLSITNKYPNVGIWGPGIVTVDFIDKTIPWIEKNCRSIFQEKKFSQTEYALQESWNSCYPPGSGFCIRKDIFLKYDEIYHAKKFTTTGVTGKSLAGAAEDIQIVYTSILMGQAVGICPEMKLAHIIPAAKANFDYIKKLRFFARYAVPLASVEIYPDKLQEYKNEQRSKSSLFIQLNRYLLHGLLTGKRKESIINCILISGNYAGVNLILHKKNPFWLMLFLKNFGIKIN
jgi:glycosyltransferase involved in cell wall biosynthesis